MSRDREAHARDRFLALLELDDAARRDAVDRLRAEDAALAARVAKLLDAHRRADARFGALPLAEPAPAPPASPPGGEHSDETGRPADFGPYRLLDRIGEGGFAVVWRAEQTDPVRRIVALKILKGAGHGEVAARFQAERQALARLDHPNVATILDGGELADGRPWFAMDFVDGRAANDPGLLSELDLGDRLDLFRQVARAVQHAHQRGILHRDLKPSNVLVARTDDGWTAKVIDFGIAKALEEPLTDQTLQTRAGQVVGTPAYLAPEQLDGGAPDTRTDVYALGALLYEVLAGRPPFDPDALLARGWTGLLQTVREQVPPPPSARTLGTGPGVDPRLLRGDLDWIVLRCLEKQPDRRYPAVSMLLDELRRHAEGRPVQAGPPAWSYRLGKFARRHRRGLAVAAVFAVALAALAGVAIRQAYETRVEAGRYREVAGFFERILHGLDPAVAQTQDTALLRTLLDDAERELDADPDMLPEVRAALLRVLGGACRGVGDVEGAEAHWREALALRRAALPPGHPDLLESMEDLGTLLLERDQLDEAETLLEPVRATRVRTLGPEDPQTRRVRGRIGTLLRARGDAAASETILRALVATARMPDGSIPVEELIHLNDLAYAVSEQGRHEEALALYREALAIQERERGPHHPQTLSALNNVGSVLLELDRTEDALPYLERALEGKRAILDPGHPDLVPALNNLARIHARVDDHDRAGALLDEAIAIARRADGDQGFRAVAMRMQRGLLLDDRGDHEAAVEELTTILPDALAGLGDEHFVTVSIRAQLCDSLLTLGRAEEAEEYGRAAAARAPQAYPEGHPARSLFVIRWGLALAACGRDDEARDVLEHEADAFWAFPDFLDEKARIAQEMARIERASGNEKAAHAWEARAVGG